MKLASGVPQQTQRQHEHHANKIIRTYTDKPRQSPWSSEAVDAQPSSERWVEWGGWLSCPLQHSNPAHHFQLVKGIHSVNVILEEAGELSLYSTSTQSLLLLQTTNAGHVFANTTRDRVAFTHIVDGKAAAHKGD